MKQEEKEMPFWTRFSRCPEILQENILEQAYHLSVFLIQEIFILGLHYTGKKLAHDHVYIYTKGHTDQRADFA